MSTHSRRVGNPPGRLAASLLGPLLAIAAWPGLADGQRAVGVVLEERSRTPVVAALVALMGPGETTRTTVSTDSSGAFLLSAPPGRYTLRVARLGFQTYNSAPIELGPGETVSLEIRLGIGAVPIDPIRVIARSGPGRGGVAEFYRRRDDPARAGGFFFSREELERNSGSRPTTVLTRVPNVELVPLARHTLDTERYVVRFRGGANGTGSCAPAIYIDGVRLYQTERMTLDEYVDLSQLEGIEVYNRPGAAPVQFTGNNDCGVVAFWTRAPEDGRDGGWKRLAIGFSLVGAFVLLLTR